VLRQSFDGGKRAPSIAASERRSNGIDRVGKMVEMQGFLGEAPASTAVENPWG
jgi:hypothetical protein